MRNKEFLQEAILISVNLYDEGLLQKLNYWTEKTNVTVYNVEESSRLIEVLADKTNDKNIKLPIIAIRRPNGFTITNPNKKPLTFDGLGLDNKLKLEYDGIKSKLEKKEITNKEYQEWLREHKNMIIEDNLASLNAIPIKLTYYVDVYTRYQKENDLYMRNLIFNFVNYPTIKLKFTYNSIPIEHNTNLILGETVSVESPNIKLFSDQICKQTLTITIDDAYLWDVRVNKSVFINEGMTLEIYDQDRDEFIIEHI